MGNYPFHFEPCPLEVKNVVHFVHYLNPGCATSSMLITHIVIVFCLEGTNEKMWQTNNLRRRYHESMSKKQCKRKYESFIPSYIAKKESDKREETLGNSLKDQIRKAITSTI